MTDTQFARKIATSENSKTVTYLDQIQSTFQRTIKTKDIFSDFISTEFIDEIKSFLSHKCIPLYFGPTLKQLKCVLTDEDSRKHEVYFQYKSLKRLSVTSVNLPYSSLQERDYSTIEEIAHTFMKHLGGLSNYFYEIESIDQFCTVMEPVNPSFKEDYRKIMLDDRTWLHVEVTPEGLASNVHLIGNSEYWHDKLQSGLLMWDHDLNIVRNVLHIFDLTEFPVVSNKSSEVHLIQENKREEPSVCSICLCDELPNYPGVPLPLCQNSTCGIFFHRLCLFQWLVACSGGRPPAFGVATGSCPTCLQPITCNETES